MPYFICDIAYEIWHIGIFATPAGAFVGRMSVFVTNRFHFTRIASRLRRLSCLFLR